MKFEFLTLTCVTSDSETFVAASRDHSLTIFKNGKSIKTVKLPGDTLFVRYINGEIISAAEHRKLTILNRKLETLKTFKVNKGPTGSIRTLTANNKYIVTGNMDGVVRYYNRTGNGLPANVSDFFRIQCTQKYNQTYYHGDSIYSMDIENDTLVSGSKDSTVQVWSLATHSKLFEVAHANKVYCVKIVGKTIVSCGQTTVRIWNLEDGKLLHKLQLPGWCWDFDISSEKTLLAVALYEGVSLWDFRNRIQIMEIKLDRVTEVRFNEQGTTLIVGQWDGQVSKIDLY